MVRVAVVPMACSNETGSNKGRAPEPPVITAAWCRNVIIMMKLKSKRSVCDGTKNIKNTQL